MSQPDACRESMQLPLTIRLTRGSDPLTMTRVAERDDGSWLVETVGASGARVKHRLSAAELSDIVVVGHPGSIPEAGGIAPPVHRPAVDRAGRNDGGAELRTAAGETIVDEVWSTSHSSTRDGEHGRSSGPPSGVRA